jgi:hypothetical protein
MRALARLNAAGDADLQLARQIRLALDVARDHHHHHHRRLAARLRSRKPGTPLDGSRI